jgi:aerobic-type carbon monoxide dehydrogenase small subunit (CoxS/CutS family)
MHVTMSEHGEATLSFRLNGDSVSISSTRRDHLADLLRDEFRLTGTHVGCEHGVCGACNVKVDGHVVRGCLMLAAQIDGSEVVTIEGLTDEGAITDLQEAFVARNALQCGFCTPGMLLTADELLRDNPVPSREEIREAISGNYCRCTGYQAIVDAISGVAQQRCFAGVDQS